MKKSEIIFGLLRIPFDAVGVSAALLLSYWLRLQRVDLIPRMQLLEPAVTLPEPSVYFSTFLLPGVLLFFCVAVLLGLYLLRSTYSAWTEAGRITTAALLWLVAVMAWYFLLRKELFYSRVLLLHSTLFITIFVGVGRAFLILIQRIFLRFGYGVRAVVTVGERSVTQEVRTVLQHDVHYSYLGHHRNLQTVRELAQEREIDLVLQTDPNPRSSETLALIDYCRSEHVGYAFLPPVLADVPHQLRVERLGLVPLIQFQPTPLDGWGRVWKHCLDVVVSIVLLIPLFPVFLLLSLGILLDSGWPVLFVSQRIGEQRKKCIPVLKFRTMVQGADTIKPTLFLQSHRRDGPLFKVKNDPRVTRFGKLLRRWSLDELPQLCNVLLGHMSLVGPRPHLPEEVKQYGSFQRRVFAVKPGITGLAQVSGRSNLTFAQEVHLDLQYIEEWTPWLDLWILWRTLVVVLGRRGAD